jgi:hypothetical protein
MPSRDRQPFKFEQELEQRDLTRENQPPQFSASRCSVLRDSALIGGCPSSISGGTNSLRSTGIILQILLTISAVIAASVPAHILGTT